MLYIATDQEMPEGARGPLTVEAIDGDLEARLAPSFSKPHLRFVGVHGGCSCDFPNFPGDEPMDYFDGLFQEDTEKERAQSVACIESLVAMVADGIAAGESVELYPAWAGYEELPPKGRIELRMQDVVPEEFFLVERFLYQIRSG